MKQLQWKKDTQFAYNSPSLTNTEIVGSGDEAKVQLEPLTPETDNIPFTTPANYSYNASEIEVGSGIAKLKELSGAVHNFPFTTPSNYTYPSDIEVVGGVSKLKSLMPTNATFHANYNSDIHGTWGDGVLTGTGYGGASVSGGELDLTGRTAQWVDYAGLDNGDSLQQGCIRFLYRPNWTGNPTAITGFFETLEGHNLNKNRIGMYMNAGTLQCFFYDGTGTYIHSLSTPWSPVANQQYEFEINFDFDIGESRLFIDGIIVASNLTQTMTRNSTTGLIRIGTNNTGTWVPDAKYDNVIIFDAVQHTANYTPLATIPPAKYAQTDPKIINSVGFVFSLMFNSFTETSTIPSGTGIQYQLSSDNGVTWKYWNGSSWATITGSQTDSWYYTNESNIASVVSVNISSLASSGTLVFRAFLHTTNIETPELDNILMTTATTYIVGSFEIAMNYDIQPTKVSHYTSIAETTVKPTDTDIKYQFSINGGSTYNGIWLSISELNTAIQSISCFFTGVDTIRFKAQLTTAIINSTPTLDNLYLISHTGFELTGEFEITMQTLDYLTWDAIRITKTQLPKTTIKVYTKSGAIVIDPLFDWVEREDGDILNFESKYFQWKVEFTTNGKTTPSLSLLEIDYFIGYLDIFHQDSITERIVRR